MARHEATLTLAKFCKSCIARSNGEVNVAKLPQACPEWWLTVVHQQQGFSLRNYSPKQLSKKFNVLGAFCTFIKKLENYMVKWQYNIDVWSLVPD